MRFKTSIFAIIIIAFTTASFAQQSAMEQFNEAMQRAQELQRTIELPDSNNSAAKAAAHSVANQVDSDEFLQRLNVEKEKIRQVLFNGFAGETGEVKEGEQSLVGQLPSDEKIFILFSETVPKETVRTYVRDLDLLADNKIALVLRGFVGGVKTVMPTMEYIESLIVKEEECKKTIQKQCDIYNAIIQIDPLVYRKFGVQRVPAFIYVKGAVLHDADFSIGNENNLNSKAIYNILYGDVSLNYVLDRFADEFGSDYLKTMAKRINSGGKLN